MEMDAYYHHAPLDAIELLLPATERSCKGSGRGNRTVYLCCCQLSRTFCQLGRLSGSSCGLNLGGWAQALRPSCTALRIQVPAECITLCGTAPG